MKLNAVTKNKREAQTIVGASDLGRHVRHVVKFLVLLNERIEHQRADALTRGVD